MAYIHIKDHDRRQQEAYVLDTFKRGKGEVTRADMDAAEVIAARSREAYNKLKQMEGTKNG